MKKINTSIIKNMCIFSAANCKEAFVYQYSNGKICFSDLPTLNHIANNVDKYVKTLYSAYRVRYSDCIRIVDMRTGEVSYYDIIEKAFCKPWKQFQNSRFW